MVSINLEQGKRAVQDQTLDEARRLLRFALKNDDLTPQERVEAYTWLAETDPSPQYKITQYQEALKVMPNHPDVLQRMAYWSQQGQPVNPQQQAFQQGLTPSQPMQPVNPQQQAFQQGLTPSQPMQPVNPQQQAFQQGLTPSQPMQPVNPQQQAFQQGLTPSQPMQPVNPQQQAFQQGLTPSQPMQPVNPQQQQTGYAYNQQAMITLQQVQRTVGIVDSAIGAGTGFFITRDGLVATTRRITSGDRELTIQLLDGQQVVGQVVRSFPDLDLSLIQTPVQVMHLLRTSQSQTIPDNMKIVAVTHHGDGIRSAKRRSVHLAGDYWIPTMINHLKDAGGNPIFDEQNFLVGMLTDNASRTSGYKYGLHIYRIYQCLEQYLQEREQLQAQNVFYCISCGIISRAPSFGGNYCENCGIKHRYADGKKLYPQPNLAGLYGENTQHACPNCGSQVGFYGGECLRCGHVL